MKILVLDDQRSARLVLRKMLRELDDVEVVEAATLDEAKSSVANDELDLLLVDIRLAGGRPDRGGLELLEWLRQTGHAVPAVMVTAMSQVADIRDAMRLGAVDYVLKDELCPEMLLPIVEGVRERHALRGEVQKLRTQVEGSWGVDAIVGSSPGMDRVRRLVRRVADADAVVLIRGETGAGKEVIARAIHQASHRSAQPFIAVNCSAMPAPLVESMIFGHERGAFTGAVGRLRGQLELAGTGTLLLDEVADMPIDLQAKLLRVLEDRRYRPLGSERELPVRARILAATNVDLTERIRDGQFREDLYYRLDVVAIDVPPLADRPEDIVELLRVFTDENARPLRYTADAIDWLQHQSWPGNVRELRNAIHRVALLADTNTIDASVLEELLANRPVNGAAEIDRIARAILALPERRGSKLKVVERAVLHHAVETCRGNKSAAARLVGVHRKSLERRWEQMEAEQGDEGLDSGTGDS